MFSRRVPSLELNRWWQARSSLSLRWDLTVSNPTQVGLAYPKDLLAPLAHPRGLIYRPHPLGLELAREAVLSLYRSQGLSEANATVVLTTSTSESYGLLAKLLADPGEGFLVPQPSYPLFEHLLRAEGCWAWPYPLPEEAGFHLDVSRIPQPPGAKAVVVVQPNNPTGTVVPQEEWGPLVQLCAQRRWALIADEVFWDFPLGSAWRGSFAGNSQCLTFTLGGLSKLVGLPQLKLGWMVVSGPPALREEAKARLEFLADTYLSVSTPVQQALPELLASAWPLRQAIGQRVVANLALLRQQLAHFPFLEVLPPEGGWSAVLRYPAVYPEEELVVELLQEDGVAVYPGYFFDFPREGFLVVSLLVEPQVLASGFSLVGSRIASKL
ncbi:MAG: pyridoxal phosphate-dependent aminotransferase [Thermoanaerobaculaceae bacterium]